MVLYTCPPSERARIPTQIEKHRTGTKYLRWCWFCCCSTFASFFFFSVFKNTFLEINSRLIFFFWVFSDILAAVATRSEVFILTTSREVCLCWFPPLPLKKNLPLISSQIHRCSVQRVANKDGTVSLSDLSVSAVDTVLDCVALHVSDKNEILSVSSQGIVESHVAVSGFFFF